MKKIMMGLERELAFVPTLRDEFANQVSDAFFGLLGTKDTYEKFFPDGKIYWDCGHVEVCTCECDGPYELTAASRAFDNRISALTSRGNFIKCNSIGDDEQSFGSHENYSSSAKPSEKILPFLASRGVISGEGGLCPDSYLPVISQRSCFIRTDTNKSTQDGRPLLNTREESHSAAHRIHLVCGGDNMSDRSLSLKFGTTAIAIRLTELGQAPQFSARQQNESWANWMRANNFILSGGIANMLAIQVTWLTAAEKAYELRSESFPAWTGRLLAEWRTTIDALTRDPREMDTQLDWRIKYRLMQNYLRSRGADPAVPASWETHFRALAEMCLHYGVLSNEGLFSKIKGRLDVTIPEGASARKEYRPSTGTRASLRAAIIRTLEAHGQCASINWSYLYFKTKQTKRRATQTVFVTMMDPASAECVIHFGDVSEINMCTCPTCSNERMNSLANAKNKYIAKDEADAISHLEKVIASG